MYANIDTTNDYVWLV